MSKSSRKGYLREQEWADLVGGKKMSRLGYEGPDVISPNKRFTPNLSVWEVKSKEDLPAWLVGPEGWLGQMEREGADAIVFRQNRKPWYMIVKISAEDLGLAGGSGDPAVDEKVRDLEGDLARLEGLQCLEHACEVGNLLNEMLDLVLKFADALAP